MAPSTPATKRRAGTEHGRCVSLPTFFFGLVSTSARLLSLATALDLVQFEDYRRRRAKEEVEPVPEGSPVVRILAATPRLLHPLDRRLVSRDEAGVVDEEAAGPDQDPEAVAPQEREADDTERRDALDAVLRPREAHEAQHSRSIAVTA